MSERNPSRARGAGGFTLVETLVAVTILTLAVAGPIYVADRAIVAARLSENQLIASYLAQEGAEYVRLLRDNAYLASFQAAGTTVSDTAWTKFLSGSDSFSISACRTNTCTVDPTKPAGTGSAYSLNPCSGGSCVALYLKPNGTYSQSNAGGAVATPFTRTVQAFEVTGSDMRVVSTVSWYYHTTPYSVTVTVHLTPWQ
jgi:type II secretory pathway pseudopilin PulG